MIQNTGDCSGRQVIFMRTDSEMPGCQTTEGNSQRAPDVAARHRRREWLGSCRATTSKKPPGEHHRKVVIRTNRFVRLIASHQALTDGRMLTV